jgi:N-dimethylarginine dimethylaminohydrolase
LLHADLGRLQAQFDEYYEVLERNGVKVHRLERPVPAIGTSSRSPASTAPHSSSSATNPGPQLD